MQKLLILIFVLLLVPKAYTQTCAVTVSNTSPCPGDVITAAVLANSFDCECRFSTLRAFNLSKPGPSATFTVPDCDPFTIQGELTGCDAHPAHPSAICGSVLCAIPISPKKLGNLGQIAWSYGIGSNQQTGLGDFDYPCLGVDVISLTLPDWECGGLTFQWDALPSGWNLVYGTLSSRTIQVTAPCADEGIFSATISHPICGSVTRSLTISRSNPPPSTLFAHEESSTFCVGAWINQGCGQVAGCTRTTNYFLRLGEADIDADGCGVDIVFTEAGQVQVCMNITNDCGTTLTTCRMFTIVACKPVSEYTVEQFENELKVYPNPAYSSFRINYPTVDGLTASRLVDATGRVVRELELTHSTLVDVTDLPSGTYFLNVVTGSFEATKKIEIVK